ncbi:MAG TPA: molybdenum cofactor biosynthesis protein MoaE [Xanthomonadales bacterium]|nr:molybdenum cofactor biosynthesis protein MoaE [Xanthomonadales bacterium]
MSAFAISVATIDVVALRRTLEHAGAGAVVTFEGTVRDHSAGRPVLRLAYDAFAPLAAKEGERILAEARERFAIAHVACAHRTGTLEIGEVAVWVGVAAAHRAAAFDACRYVIDELKQRVPIWKKEFYADGEGRWSPGAG